MFLNGKIMQNQKKQMQILTALVGLANISNYHTHGFSIMDSDIYSTGLPLIAVKAEMQKKKDEAIKHRWTVKVGTDNDGAINYVRIGRFYALRHEMMWTMDFYYL